MCKRKWGGASPTETTRRLSKNLIRSDSRLTYCAPCQPLWRALFGWIRSHLLQDEGDYIHVDTQPQRDTSSTMRGAAHPSGCAKCGAGAGWSAIKYQSLTRRMRKRKRGRASPAETTRHLSKNQIRSEKRAAVREKGRCVRLCGERAAVRTGFWMSPFPLRRAHLGPGPHTRLGSSMPSHPIS